MSCNWDKPTSSQTDLWLHLCDLLTCLSSSTSPQHSEYLFSYSGIQLHPTGTFATHPQVQRQGTKPPRNAGGRSGKKRERKITNDLVRSRNAEGQHDSWKERRSQHRYLWTEEPWSWGQVFSLPRPTAPAGSVQPWHLVAEKLAHVSDLCGRQLLAKTKQGEKKSGRKEQKRVVWNCWPHAFSRSTKHEALTTPLAALPLKISAGDHTGHLPYWCLPVIDHNFSVIIQRKNQRKQKNIKTASARTQELILCSPTKARAFAKKQLPLLPQDRTRQPQCF